MIILSKKKKKSETYCKCIAENSTCGFSFIHNLCIRLIPKLNKRIEHCCWWVCLILFVGIIAYFCWSREIRSYRLSRSLLCIESSDSLKKNYTLSENSQFNNNNNHSGIGMMRTTINIHNNAHIKREKGTEANSRSQFIANSSFFFNGSARLGYGFCSNSSYYWNCLGTLKVFFCFCFCFSLMLFIFYMQTLHSFFMHPLIPFDMAPYRCATHRSTHRHTRSIYLT